MRRYSIFLLSVGLSISFLFSQNPYVDVQQAVDDITNHSAMEHAQWGFVLRDVETGKILLSENPDETLLPASTMKTVTTGAALGILGEDYTFKTYLEHDGEIVDGVLKGNLYIRGGGDPSLGSDRFDSGLDLDGLLDVAVEILNKKGIVKVEGDVIGDASIFEDAMLPTTWVWSDIGNYYGSGASGLTVNENTYYLYFEPNKTVGDSAKLLRVEPEIPGIEFVNEMKTGARYSGDQGYIYGSPYTFLRYLRGTIPQGKAEFSIKGSIPDPALYAAQRLKGALVKNQIPVGGDAETIRILSLEGTAPEAKRTKIYTYESPPLKDIIYWLNKKSVNLFAEHLVKIIGYKVYLDGSNASGTRAIREWWAKKGVDVDGLHMKDGSGLSRYNGVTPAQLTKMLVVDAKQATFTSFYNSLPIAGVSTDPGTIRRLCKNTSAANNLRAKSGYISRVRCYTGYVDTKSGKRLCFAMMSNNYTCKNRAMRDMFEKLMVVMAEVP